jgi:asparagine synthase (glutamine-hydrolysing)
MCGIAGMIDLVGRRPLPPGALEAMAGALVHRGPDDDGFLRRPGLGLASRRLSIVGLADGRQPLANEDQSVQVVFNGELYDFPEIRVELTNRGHRFTTHTDTELIPHLWEDFGEATFEKLRGQFAVALWDQRQQRLLLARDRFGICPLVWAERDGWLLFASEVKGLLASGLVKAQPDLRGIDQVFTFMSLPGPLTCFAGVQQIRPGWLLEVQLDTPGQRAKVSQRAFWEMNFPDAGDEGAGLNPKGQVDRFEELLLRAVQRRLRADVPVVVCLSGGVDSTLVAAMARRLSGQTPATFSIHIDAPMLDESSQIATSAQSVGAAPVIKRCGRDELVGAFARTIQASESPIVDTSCAAVLLLSENIHAHGYKAALTGQGADECLAGYVWFKVTKVLKWIDEAWGLPVSELLRRAYARATTPYFSWESVRRAERAALGWNPYFDLYALGFLARYRFYGAAMHAIIAQRSAYEELNLPVERMRRWDPINRALYLGVRTLLSGMLLTAKGDLASMHSSVELRHPFLDEDLFDFCAQLPPRAKLHGFREKYILRQVAARWLPRELAWRRKTMFMAPGDTFYAPAAQHNGSHPSVVARSPDRAASPNGGMQGKAALVDQLLSEESLRRAGYFDPQAVLRWRKAYRNMWRLSVSRTSVELGLAVVASTQLWHHLYIDGNLAELPTVSG